MTSKEKFETIINYLEELPEEDFNFKHVGNPPCGTSGCVLGHLPLAFSESDQEIALGSALFGYPCLSPCLYPSFRDEEGEFNSNIEEFLNVTEEELELLTEPNVLEFYGNGYYPELDQYFSDIDLEEFAKKFYDENGNLDGSSSVEEVLKLWKEFYQWKFVD